VLLSCHCQLVTSAGCQIEPPVVAVVVLALVVVALVVALVALVLVWVVRTEVDVAVEAEEEDELVVR